MLHIYRVGQKDLHSDFSKYLGYLQRYWADFLYRYSWTCEYPSDSSTTRYDLPLPSPQPRNARMLRGTSAARHFHQGWTRRSEGSASDWRCCCGALRRHPSPGWTRSQSPLGSGAGWRVATCPRRRSQSCGSCTTVGSLSLCATAHHLVQRRSRLGTPPWPLARHALPVAGRSSTRSPSRPPRWRPWVLWSHQMQQLPKPWHLRASGDETRSGQQDQHQTDHLPRSWRFAGWSGAPRWKSSRLTKWRPCHRRCVHFLQHYLRFFSLKKNRRKWTILSGLVHIHFTNQQVKYCRISFISFLVMSRNEDVNLSAPPCTLKTEVA